MSNSEIHAQPAQVDINAVLQVLSGKVASLITENAMLQARVMDLEGLVKKQEGKGSDSG